MTATNIPKTIVLDLKPQLEEFEQEIAPFILGTEHTAATLIDTLWEAFFDKESADERLLDTVVWVISRDPVLQHATAKQRLSDVVFNFAQALHYQVESHGLYFDRGYLPYNLEIDPYKNIILRRDDDIDKLQQVWKEELGDEDEEG